MKRLANRKGEATLRGIRLLKLLTVALGAALFVSCKRTGGDALSSALLAKPVVLLTNIKEAPLYVEMFNSENNGTVVSLRYSENPASVIADKAKGYADADIVMSPYLQSKIQYFCDIGSACKADKGNNAQKFYPQLLEAGRGKGGMFGAFDAQRLLPVSFNVRCVVFDAANAEKVAGNESGITLDEMKESSASFTAKGQKGYTKMGFVPQANDEFLYLVTSMRGANWSIGNDRAFVWNEAALKNSISYLMSWLQGSAEESTAFANKYLMMPPQKKVTSGKCLFTVVTSDALFRMALGDAEIPHTGLGFRYIVDKEGQCVACDDMVMLGVKKRSKETMAFVKWLLDAGTQQRILERKNELDLEMAMFGIAGGFSSIAEVNDGLLGTGSPRRITAQERVPCEWDEIKTEVIIPYIKDALNGKDSLALDARADKWQSATSPRKRQVETGGSTFYE